MTHITPSLTSGSDTVYFIILILHQFISKLRKISSDHNVIQYRLALWMQVLMFTCVNFVNKMRST